MVSYAYYGGTNLAYGVAGDLESATEQISTDGGNTWTGIGSYYYRYYVSDANGLEMAFSPQEVQNAGGLSSVEGMTNNELAHTRTWPFNMNIFQRVDQATISGLYTYHYSYMPSESVDGDPNAWSKEAIEVRPDSTTYKVYTNFLGETVLTDLTDSASHNWYTAWIYGTDGSQDQSDGSANGLLLQEDMPSSITGATAYLSGWITLYTPLAGKPQGLVYDYSYYDYSSDMPGYLYQTLLQNGINADPSTAVLLEQYTYATQSGLNDGVTVTVHPLSSTTVYPTAGGDGNETDYNYTWYTDTVQIQQETTSLPIVTTGQNGPGGTSGVDNWQTKDVFDASGNLVWEEDADGRFTYNAYDPVTGLVTETIADCTTDFSVGSETIPPPPDPLPESGINAETDYLYNDPLGRVTQVLGPAFVDDAGDTVRSGTWTSYNDSLLTLGTGQGEGGQGTEVRMASGFEVVSPAAGSAYSAGQFVLVNPISVQIANLDGQLTDQIQAEDDDGTGLTVVESSSTAVLSELASVALPTTTFSRWTHNDYATQADTSTNHYYAAGQLIDTQDYTAIQSTVYNETFFRYDTMGRQSEVLDPTGDITQTAYNALGLATSIYVGTSDGTLWPGDLSATASNMVELTGYQYDFGKGGGDGLLTATTQYVDANSGDNRLTQYGYDWRDRQSYVVNPPDAQGNITYTMTTYDNADEATDTQQYLYQGAAADLPADLKAESAAASPTPLNGSDLLLAWTHASYDNLGQVYQTTVYGVYPEDCGSLVSNTWYDADGNPIETQAGGTQEFTKTTYNGLDEPTVVYVGFDPSGNASTFSSAGSVADDTILEETQNTFDGAGDTTFVTTYERYDDAPTGDSGALDALGASDSRASYVAYWFDGIGRETAEQNFGATAAAPTPTAAKPGTDTSGATQVSLIDYNARGEAYETVDPAGNVTLTTFDDEGRTIEAIQNYSTTISAATNITTDYQFNAGTALLSATSVTTEKADLSGTQTQITAYVYGTATDDPSPAIYRDDLVCAVVSGLSPSYNLATLVGEIEDGDTSGLNVVEYQFDRQGETIQMTDQNGTQHDYTLDGLGRQVSDAVTLPAGSLINNSVLRIDTAYDFQGNVALTTSYSSTNGGSANVVNQVADTYNGFGLLTEEQQSVSGAVTSSTPAVLYSYSSDSLDAHPPDRHHLPQRPRLDLWLRHRRGQRGWPGQLSCRLRRHATCRLSRISGSTKSTR